MAAPLKAVETRYPQWLYRLAFGMPQLPLRERVIDLEVPEDDVARGRALRKATPRSALAELSPSPRSAAEILTAQDADRLPELVPLRYARMLADPFSFYRGSAAVMAADLAAGPSSGIHVVCCGDAHLSNFGIYAAPDRKLVFDLNDFDEAAFGPWEWDLKRLITSAIVGGRQIGCPSAKVRACVHRSVETYQDALGAILQLDLLDRYYLRFEPALYRARMRKSFESVVAAAMRRARTRTSAQVFQRIMMVGDDGTPRLRERPPVLEHIPLDSERKLVRSINDYVSTVPADVAVLLSHFRVTDLARRVVGVGSVGTRCYLAILTGPDGTPLVLQIKEATRSVLDEYGGIQQPRVLWGAVLGQGDGARIVYGQRILQASSDALLGMTRYKRRGYYVRQFRDMKGNLDITGMSPSAFREYVSVCALLLARAHAQSLNASMLRGYVGNNATVRQAVIDWCYAYADKSLDDFHQLRAAAKAGDICVAKEGATRV